MASVIPLGNRALVRLEKLPSGSEIIKPERFEDEPISGIVLSVPEGSDLAVGKRVFFAPYSGSATLQNELGEQVKIIAVDQLLAEMDPQDSEVDGIPV